MAEQKNKSAEQLLSDLHQKRLEQALNEFNADKTRMAVGRLLEEYVDDGGQSYFDGAQKDATLYFVDDDYMDKVREIFPNAFPGKDGKSVELNFEDEKQNN